MIKLFFSILVLCLTTANVSAINNVSKNTIEFVIPFMPGGGTDFQATSLESAVLATNPDIKIKKKYFNSCSAALSYAQQVSASTPTYFFADVGDLILGDSNKGARCPPVNTLTAPISPLTKLGSVPLFLCATPKHSHNLPKLLQQHKIKVGYATNSAIVAVAKKLNNSQYLVVPYQSSNELKTAIGSGDIEMFLGANTAIEYINQGAKCIAISSAEKIMGLPSLTQFFKKPIPEWNVTTVLFQIGNRSDITSQVKKATMNKLFTDALATKGLYNHALVEENVIDSIIKQEKKLVELD